MIDIETVLRDKIKPELNFLYTEKPAWRDGGVDFGWFCREHAYHAYFLCKMLGADTQMVVGHVSLHTADGEEVLSSFGEDCDHAWLRLGQACPVDLSFTLEYFDVGLPSVDIVFGTGRRGDYFVTYENGTAAEEGSVPAGCHHIRYAEQDVFSATWEALLADPFMFLIRPRKDGIATRLGNDIHAKITYHLFRIATGEIGGYREYVRPWSKAMERIGRRNFDAKRRTQELLEHSLAWSTRERKA